jgi:hypothetical protein
VFDIETRVLGEVIALPERAEFVVIGSDRRGGSNGRTWRTTVCTLCTFAPAATAMKNSELDSSPSVPTNPNGRTSTGYLIPVRMEWPPQVLEIPDVVLDGIGLTLHEQS